MADARLWHAPWLYPGQHAAMAGLATSGTLTHWFRDQFARELPRETAFATLTAEAMASPPGARGLICLPYFSGERTPIHNPQAKGAFFGLNLTHGRGDMYRAVLEGIASATRHITDTYAQAGAPPKRVLAVGGGTKNRPWLQATSDLTGLDQVVARVTTGASFGNAFLAARAIGVAARIEDWNPVAEVVRARTRTRSMPGNTRCSAGFTSRPATSRRSCQMRLEHMRPHQIRAAIAAHVPAVLPIGVQEYHGEHLPVGVDLLAVTRAVERLEAEAPERLILLPAFAYGAASHRRGGACGDGDPACRCGKLSALCASAVCRAFEHRVSQYPWGDPSPDREFRRACRRI